MRTLTIVAALVLWAGEAGARELGTGNGLLALCESKELWENATCNGFVAGANSSYKVLKAAEAIKADIYCLPDGVSYEQLTRVVTKYLREHPAELHYSSGASVILALKGAFPCTKK